MKLILASSGLNAPESVAKCLELVGKPAKDINFAVINEAMAVEYGNHDWFLNDMDGIRNNFGGNIEFVNLLANDIKKVEERLNAADVVWVEGGNTDYLATVLVKTGFDELLPKILKTKVYVGSSAGSQVLGHRPSYKVNEENYNETAYTDKYMDLVDFTILPHLNSMHFNTRVEAWVLEDSKTQNSLVYAVSDDAAVIVDGDKTYVIGKDYLIAKNGQVIERG